MTHALPNADLYTPSLTAEDDATDIRQPWNPWSLVVLAFFFGLPAGGGLLAWNYERLGMRGRVWWAAALIAVLTLLQFFLAGWVWTLEPVRENEAVKQGINFAGRCAITLVAIALATTQRRRFRLSQMSQLPQGHLLWPAVVASVLSVLLSFGLAFVVAFAYSTLGFLR